MKKLKILELFSGTQSIGKEFRKKGHEVLSIELNHLFSLPPWNLNQLTIDILDLKSKQVIKLLGGYPDVVWSSPMCTTHSIAAISHHRQQGENGLLYAKSDNAKIHDKVLLKTLQLISELKPKYFFIENPRGGMRKSPFMQGVFHRYTITYCQYGDTRMKPTDIWTNHPNPEFKPMCKNGDPCHEAAPRGSRTGTQGLKGNHERSKIPQELCEEIVSVMDHELQEIRQDGWLSIAKRIL